MDTHLLYLQQPHLQPKINLPPEAAAVLTEVCTVYTQLHSTGFPVSQHGTVTQTLTTLGLEPSECRSHKNSAENQPTSQERVPSPTVTTALKLCVFSDAGKKSITAHVTAPEEQQSLQAAVTSLGP